MWKLQQKFLQYEGKKIEAQFFGYLARNLAAILTALYRLRIMLVQVANRKTKIYRKAPNACQAAPAKAHAADGFCFEYVNSVNLSAPELLFFFLILAHSVY